MHPSLETSSASAPRRLPCPRQPSTASASVAGLMVIDSGSAAGHGAGISLVGGAAWSKASSPTSDVHPMIVAHRHPWEGHSDLQIFHVALSGARSGKEVKDGTVCNLAGCPPGPKLDRASGAQDAHAARALAGGFGRVRAFPQGREPTENGFLQSPGCCQQDRCLEPGPEGQGRDRRQCW